MGNISAFLDMGGYSQYVWPAYGLTALVLVVLLAVSLKAMRARERELGASEHHRRKRREDRSGRQDET